MADCVNELTGLEPRHGFFIGVDSDGCVFDTMTIKQMRCFCPNTIKQFGLDPLAGYVRDATAFVNLYSKFRGMNRYPAILMVLNLLAQRPEVAASGVRVPELRRLRQWIQEESTLSKSALRSLVERTGDEELRTVLTWADAVDASIEAVVKGVSPFPGVRESLERAVLKADILVVSQTPLEALRREWVEHDLIRYVRLIAGQEHGTKAEHLALATRGKYEADRILMIGDAQGDFQAARDNKVSFFPIVPGKETDSWKRFHDEALNRFLAGTFKGVYEAALFREFDAALPEHPNW
jgi:phosphoglycolate phosphatase-like HAD superfamily hydrolase